MLRIFSPQGGIVVSFCPVCGSNHGPNTPCFNRTEELLRGAGIPKKKHRPRKHSNTKTSKSHFPDIVDASLIVFCTYALSGYIGNMIFFDFDRSTPYKHLLGVITVILSH